MRTASSPTSSSGFSCVYRNNKGTLFTTSEGISFVGKSLFCSKNVSIKWTDILEIVNHDEKLIAAGSHAACISLITDDDESTTTHEFKKLKEPKQALKSLVSFHNESMHERLVVDDVSTTSCDTSGSDDLSQDIVDAELEHAWKEIQKDDSHPNSAIQVRTVRVIDACSSLCGTDCLTISPHSISFAPHRTRCYHALLTHSLTCLLPTMLVTRFKPIKRTPVTWM